MDSIVKDLDNCHQKRNHKRREVSSRKSNSNRFLFIKSIEESSQTSRNIKEKWTNFEKILFKKISMFRMICRLLIIWSKITLNMNNVNHHFVQQCFFLNYSHSILHQSDLWSEEKWKNLIRIHFDKSLLFQWKYLKTIRCSQMTWERDNTFINPFNNVCISRRKQYLFILRLTMRMQRNHSNQN